MPESLNSWLSDQLLSQSFRGDIQNTLPARLSVPSGLGVYLRAGIMSGLSAALHLAQEMTLNKDGLESKNSSPVVIEAGRADSRGSSITKTNQQTAG